MVLDDFEERVVSESALTAVFRNDPPATFAFAGDRDLAGWIGECYLAYVPGLAGIEGSVLQQVQQFLVVAGIGRTGIGEACRTDSGASC